MSERKFHEALLEYFNKRLKECGSADAMRGPIENVVNGLELLVRLERNLSGRENKKVHIGHTFGPFGFKVK